MKAHWLVLFICIAAKGSLLAQTSETSRLDSIAALLLQGERGVRIDVASYQQKKLVKVATALERIAKDSYNYSDLMAFWNLHAGSVEGKPQQIGLFENMGAKLNPLSKPLDSDYLEYIWVLTSMYRNANNLPKSDSLNNVMAAYVDRIPEDHMLKAKGQVYVQIHQNMLLMIQRNPEQGIPNAKKVLTLAQNTGDTNLVITAGYYLAEFYVMTRNMPYFLQLVEHNYQLDSGRYKKSHLYSSTIFQWLDALIYTGDRPDKVEELIHIIERYSHLTAKSLEYRLMYMSNLKSDSEAFTSQLKRFDAENLPAFVQQLDAKAKAELNPNDYTYFLVSAAKALYQHAFYHNAMSHMQRAIGNTEDVYARQLSQDLAAIEANRVEREKNIEIAAEKEKTQLYTILAITASLLLLVGLLVIVLLVRQSKQLKAKNHEIESQRLLLEKTDGEKALLLKEIHHRIKNNFQIVSSLLELQSRGIEDEKARELAEEGKNRVKSMALIHQRLYQNDDLLISFDEYTKALVDEIIDMYAPDEPIDLKIDAKDVHLDVDTAIPLGLIINELVTNAFKYGLEQSEKKLDIVLQRASTTEYQLIVKDNGQGMPDGFNVEQSTSLGLRLVKRLTKQLKGKVEVLNQNGAVFYISFKDTEARAALS